MKQYAVIAHTKDGNVLISPKYGEYFSTEEEAKAAAEEHKDMGAEIEILEVFDESRELWNKLEDFVGFAHRIDFICGNVHFEIMAPCEVDGDVVVYTYDEDGLREQAIVLEAARYLIFNDWNVVWNEEKLVDDLIEAIENWLEDFA